MKLSGRRESTNVDDRRGMGRGGKAGLGLGGLIVVGLITWLMGGIYHRGDTFSVEYSNL